MLLGELWEEMKDEGGIKFHQGDHPVPARSGRLLRVGNIDSATLSLSSRGQIIRILGFRVRVNSPNLVPLRVSCGRKGKDTNINKRDTNEMDWRKCYFRQNTSL